MTFQKRIKPALATRTLVPAIPFLMLPDEVEDDEDFFFLDSDLFHAREEKWCKPHRHRNLHHLAWVEAGGGSVIIGNDEHAFEPGLFINIPPNVIHNWKMSSRIRGDILSVSTAFLFRHVRPGLHGGDMSVFERPFVFAAGADRRAFVHFSSSFNYARDMWARSDTGRIAGLTASILMIAAQASSVANGAAEERGLHRDDTLVSQFRSLVDDRFIYHDRVAEYCLALKVSETRLERACQTVAGSSPMELIHKRLVGEAKSCLFHSTLSVTEIAYALGFTDPAYFSRFFSRHENLSPAAYRRGYEQRKADGLFRVAD